MSTWELYQRMLRTPAEELHKIRKAIQSKYKTSHEPGEVYSVLDAWEKKSFGWLSDRELVKDEEAREALIDEGLL